MAIGSGQLTSPELVMRARQIADTMQPLTLFYTERYMSDNSVMDMFPGRSRGTAVSDC